jgi:hypothetical protein
MMKPLPQINSWADVQAQTLTKAEQELIDAVKAGNPVGFGDTVPTAPTDAVLIRAPLLRYLILGGCAECRTPAKGVTVFGAWIAQELDLQYESAARPIMLADCHIAEQPNLLQLQAAGLILNGSKLPKGLTAQGAIITGNLFLRSIHAQGEVNIAGAQITGQLDCDGATLENADGDALNAQGVKVGEGVFLGNVTTKGRVSLSGAQITGQLSCTGATLENAGGDALDAQRAKVGASVFLSSVTTKGGVTFAGAQIAGQLDCEGATLENAKGVALNLQGASVKDGLIWRRIKKVKGVIDLNSAFIRVIADDATSWDECEDIKLVGLTYDFLHGTPDLPARLAWLKKGAVWDGEFSPQPYEQLAKVWRANGYRADAADVLVAKEHALAKATRARDEKNESALARKATTGYFEVKVRHRLLRLWDYLLRIVAGYGHRPQLSIRAIVILILLTAVIALATWRAGDFVPNSAPILISDEWQAFAKTADNPAREWTLNATAGRDYETFNALVYAADVVIPLVGFGQEVAWTPTTSRGPMGWVMLITKWVMIALGWIVTAIGAAAVTGIIRRE